MAVHSKTLLLANPAAGRGRARRALARVAAYLREQGHAAEIVETASGEALERTAAQAAAAGYARVAALGGDGTFQGVVRGLLGTDVVLGLLPAGGGNDLAAALGIPRDPVAAAHVFLGARPRSMDVLRARFAGGKTAIYLGGGGLGLDAEAAALAETKFRRLPGAARYLAGALWAAASFQPFNLHAEIDGKQIISDRAGLLLAAINNTPTYGAGVRIAPDARVDDGLLEIVLVRQLSWLRLVEAIPLLLQSGRIHWPEIERYRGRQVVLHTNRPVAFQGDGEILGESPVEIEVLPAAIRVAAPARA